jgi:hypothetical protein
MTSPLTDTSLSNSPQMWSPLPTTHTLGGFLVLHDDTSGVPSKIMILHNTGDDLDLSELIPGQILPLLPGSGTEEGESIAEKLTAWRLRGRENLSPEESQESIMLFRPDIKLSASTKNGTKQSQLHVYLSQRMYHSLTKWYPGNLRTVRHAPRFSDADFRADQPIKHTSSQVESYQPVAIVVSDENITDEQVAQELYDMVGKRTSDWCDTFLSQFGDYTRMSMSSLNGDPPSNSYGPPVRELPPPSISIR